MNAESTPRNRIYYSHIMETDFTIGAFARGTTRTMYLALGISQWHVTPIMVGYIQACSSECRSTRPPRTLHGRSSRDGILTRDEPFPVPELSVACGVGEALHALLESLAFLAATGGAVLAGLAVTGVIPLQAAEKFILRSIGECVCSVARPKYEDIG
jgi:hypothetical protein